MRLLVPPTIYFFCAFNLIVSDDQPADPNAIGSALSTFLTATTLALLVGKAVLVADKFRAIDRFPQRAADQADPLQDGVLRPRRACCFGSSSCLCISPSPRGFRRRSRGPRRFTWHRFAAIQIWLFVCFLIYVTASQVSAALGPGKLKQLMFRPR